MPVPLSQVDIDVNPEDFGLLYSSGDRDEFERQPQHPAMFDAIDNDMDIDGFYHG